MILERWGNWSKHRIESDVGYSAIAAGVEGLLAENSTGMSCTENDALIIDACVGRLKQKRPEEYALLSEHYIKDISKSELWRKLKLSEGMIRIK
ncbi:antiterminator Q family protein, partial [Erwinia amylovora]|uniref:antiterminator Q family protein n=1 Tax=Erwinia amylovora TaxID=552 RepID=UPI0020BDB2C7